MAASQRDLTPDVQHIACIGLMGAGKSSVGGALAHQLDWPFVDVDDLIERMTGCTVAQLWEQGGEDAYRPLEHEIVVDVLGARERSVLATPGGVVLDPGAVHAIEANDVVAVYLRADPGVLAERIARDADHQRPLVDDRPEAVMSAMFAARDATYLQVADHVLDVDDLTIDQAAAAVLHLLVGDVLRPTVG